MLRTLGMNAPTFRLKVLALVAVVAVADLLFVWHEPGTTLGLFCLAWLGGLALVRPDVLRDRRGRWALAASLFFALVLCDRPGVLAWCLFGLSVSIAALSPRVRAGEPAFAWAQRLFVHGVVGLVGPMLDLMRLSRLNRRKGLTGLAIATRLVLPVGGGLLFLALFAAANPLISNALDGLFQGWLSARSIGRAVFWGFVAVLVATSLRPRWKRTLAPLPERAPGRPSAARTQSIVWSLVVFNAVFALQNGLDIAFLWSGAPLPGDVTLADYAHRGAYALIFTALLAGLFVLVALQPNAETARHPLVRRLVVAWIAQNMLLVASSILRTADYIEVYSLTRLRIAALIWMGLVAVGLGLIVWRMLRGKSAHWLIDANVGVALSVLSIVSVVDLGAFAAAWNVRHAREAGGRGVELDIGYLRDLGPPALVSIAELELASDDRVFRDRLAAAREEIVCGMWRDRGEWRGWIWRDQRRLDRVQSMWSRGVLAPAIPGARDWNLRLEPRPAPAPAAPLTSSAGD